MKTDRKKKGLQTPPRSPHISATSPSSQTEEPNTLASPSDLILEEHRQNCISYTVQSPSSTSTNMETKESSNQNKNRKSNYYQSTTLSPPTTTQTKEKKGLSRAKEKWKKWRTDVKIKSKYKSEIKSNQSTNKARNRIGGYGGGYSVVAKSIDGTEEEDEEEEEYLNNNNFHTNSNTNGNTNGNTNFNTNDYANREEDVSNEDDYRRYEYENETKNNSNEKRTTTMSEISSKIKNNLHKNIRSMEIFFKGNNRNTTRNSTRNTNRSHRSTRSQRGKRLFISQKSKMLDDLEISRPAQILNLFPMDYRLSIISELWCHVHSKKREKSLRTSGNHAISILEEQLCSTHRRALNSLVTSRAPSDLLIGK